MLAVDLGAASGRAVLGRFDGERMEMQEVRRFSTPVAEADGHILWDVHAIEEEIWAALRAALTEAPDLRSVSVNSWGVDYVRLDAGGRPLGLPYCYRDPRLDGVMASVLEKIPAEDIYERTGVAFLPFNTLYQLAADRREGLQAARCLMIADYFNYRLGGRPAAEASLASTTQMVDIHTGQWAVPLLQKLGLDPSPWPEIVPSGAVLGAVRGHPDVAVVATCSHDTALAVAAAPATGSGTWAYVSCGTWSLFGMERAAPVVTPAALAAGYANEIGLDGSIRLLKNLTGLWVLQECAREWGGAAWEELEEAARAARSPGAALDLEDARFLRRGGMERRVLDALREQGAPLPASRGELCRAILESIADSYRRALADLERVAGERIDVLHIVGGGSQNGLLCACTAQACGRPAIAGPAEATALGNMLVQLRTLGGLPDGVSLREVSARSCNVRTYRPGGQVLQGLALKANIRHFPFRRRM